MILVIDGYNLIKNIARSKFVTPAMRQEYINKLSIYSRKKNHEVIIVFDGGGFAFPSKEVVKNVTVIYSGYKTTADDVIKEYIQQNRGKDLLIISSDREIQKFAHSFSIESMKIYDFYALFQQNEENADVKKLSKMDTLVKSSATENPQLDELMKQIGNVYTKKEDVIISNKESGPRKDSKQEKKLIQKIKKL